MPGANYLSNYQNLRLNEVIIPGSHDAGVYTLNSANVQTQDLDIDSQANAGCRFFDLRIATVKRKVQGQVVYEHKAFHLDQKLVVNHKVKNTPGITSYQNVGHAGGWGDGLTNMLAQARAFVVANATEFLILKFSKCKNWSAIADACVTQLGTEHYTGAGNINTCTVGSLAGKVITVFDESAGPELAPVIAAFNGQPHGIRFVRTLYDNDSGTSRAYDPNFSGIQYFGKFSSTDKVDTNTKKQAGILTGGAATHIDALGMMYWTTTGIFGSIRTRNDQMWTQTNIRALQQTWNSGLEAAIQSRFGRERDDALRLAMTSGGALGGRLKAFMPNIVMMDFVDLQKCTIIDQLNVVAATSLQQLMVPAPRGPQPHPDPIGP
jgi:hypothetical protein